MIKDFDKCIEYSKHDINGGYIAISQNDALKLIGIYSFGAKSCFENAGNEIGYFTRIDKYLEWISVAIHSGECN